jgi:hypothetical protein
MPDIPTADLALLDEVSFPDARGGRRPSGPAVQIAIARALTQDDLETLATRQAAPQGQRLARIRHSHHLLAQCLARGSTQAEASAITGYDPAYISALRGDPAFEELLAHYAGVAGELFVDVMERMKALGLSTIDEIAHRFESDPEAFSNRELMELAELMLIKPKRLEQAQGAGAGAGAGAPTININFVAPKALPSGEDSRPKLGVIDQ